MPFVVRKTGDASSVLGSRPQSSLLSLPDVTGNYKTPLRQLLPLATLGPLVTMHQFARSFQPMGESKGRVASAAPWLTCCLPVPLSDAR